MLVYRPAGELVLMIAASTGVPSLDFSRQYTAAWWHMHHVPRRCTRITASKSSTLMLKIIRSRKMPALLTTTSNVPHCSIAASMRCLAPSKSETSSPLAIASPPDARIRSTTSPDGPLDEPLPSSSAPMSLTTTLAPWRGNSRACARARPPRRPTRRAAAVELGADVVDDDFGALAGEFEGMRAAQPTPGAGDDDDA